MADAGTLQSLLNTKAALDLGLISQADFDAVKGAFLRAQQIKAAVDVGLIKPEDYEETKQSYLGSLLASDSSATLVTAPAAAPATTAAAARPAPAAAAAAAHGMPPRKASSSWSVPQPAAKSTPPAAAPAHSAAPAPAAAAASQQHYRQQPPAPAPRPVERQPSNPDVPTNIPKMGGIKSMSEGTSMSGITVSEDAVNLFYLMRLKATYKWAMWQVDDSGTTVIIAAVGDKNASWREFLASLPDSDCRYAVYDFDVHMPDGQVLHKMVFLNWAPDNAKVKSKMMYASTKDFFKKHLDGISLEFQASDRDDITEQEVRDALRALKRG